jgi:hypothetical protein
MFWGKKEDDETKEDFTKKTTNIDCYDNKYNSAWHRAS